MLKNNCEKCGAALVSGKCPVCGKTEWDHTLTCLNCGLKKHIGIDEGDEVAGDRMNLIDFEQDKARCCKKPDLYMYPLKPNITRTKG